MAKGKKNKVSHEIQPVLINSSKLKELRELQGKDKKENKGKK